MADYGLICHDNDCGDDYLTFWEITILFLHTFSKNVSKNMKYAPMKRNLRTSTIHASSSGDQISKMVVNKKG